VSRDSNESAGSADAWLPEGLRRRRRSGGKSSGPERDSVLGEASPAADPPLEEQTAGANAWLVAPGTKKTRPPTPAGGDARPAPRPAGGKQGARETVEKHEDELKEALTAQEAQLTAAFESRQAELTKTFETKEAKLHRRIEELETELAEAKSSLKKKSVRKSATAKPAARARTGTKAKTTSSRRAEAKRNGRLDLNEATFEELRGLGLSVTQSARLIAYRDVRGGYRSLDELEAIPGLSADTRADLRVQLRL
jgi:competence protein ComEA